MKIIQWKDIAQHNANNQAVSAYITEAEIAITRILVQSSIDEEKAELERAINDLKERKTGLTNRSQSLLLQILGTGYSKLAKHTEAIESVKDAMRIREKILPANHVDLARTNYKLAECLMRQISTLSRDEQYQQLQSAREYCNKAFDVQKTQLSKDHSNLIDNKKLMKSINDQLNELS